MKVAAMLTLRSTHATGVGIGSYKTLRMVNLM